MYNSLGDYIPATNVLDLGKNDDTLSQIRFYRSFLAPNVFIQSTISQGHY